MKNEREEYNRDLNTLYDKCIRYLYYHTILTMKNRSTLDGIIENVDENRIIVLVGKNVMESENPNQYSQQLQYRRFEHQNIPLTELTGLYLLPYPYIAPPYPYYPFHPPYHLDYPKH